MLFSPLQVGKPVPFFPLFFSLPHPPNLCPLFLFSFWAFQFHHLFLRGRFFDFSPGEMFDFSPGDLIDFSPGFLFHFSLLYIFQSRMLSFIRLPIHYLFQYLLYKGNYYCFPLHQGIPLVVFPLTLFLRFFAYYLILLLLFLLYRLLLEYSIHLQAPFLAILRVLSLLV